MLSNDERTASISFGSALLLPSPSGFGLRLYTKAQLLRGRGAGVGVGRPYHLRRAQFAVAHFPRRSFFDPLMNLPDGGVPIWPPLFDVALATPCARCSTAPGAAARRSSSAARPGCPSSSPRGRSFSPAFSAGVSSATPAARGAALFLAVCPGHLLWTQYGHTDQHVAESFFGLLVLVLFLRLRDEPDSRARRFGAVWTGLALGLAVLAWQGAIYWGAILALSLFLEAAPCAAGFSARPP